MSVSWVLRGLGTISIRISIACGSVCRVAENSELAVFSSAKWNSARFEWTSQLWWGSYRRPAPLQRTLSVCLSHFRSASSTLPRWCTVPVPLANLFRGFRCPMARDCFAHLIDKNVVIMKDFHCCQILYGGGCQLYWGTLCELAKIMGYSTGGGGWQCWIHKVLLNPPVPRHCLRMFYVWLFHTALGLCRKASSIVHVTQTSLKDVCFTAKTVLHCHSFEQMKCTRSGSFHCTLRTWLHHNDFVESHFEPFISSPLRWFNFIWACSKFSIWRECSCWWPCRQCHCTRHYSCFLGLFNRYFLHCFVCV